MITSLFIHYSADPCSRLKREKDTQVFWLMNSPYEEKRDLINGSWNFSICRSKVLYDEYSRHGIQTALLNGAVKIYLSPSMVATICTRCPPLQREASFPNISPLWKLVCLTELATF